MRICIHMLNPFIAVVVVEAARVWIDGGLNFVRSRHTDNSISQSMCSSTWTSFYIYFFFVQIKIRRKKSSHTHTYAWRRTSINEKEEKKKHFHPTTICKFNYNLLMHSHHTPSSFDINFHAIQFKPFHFKCYLPHNSKLIIINFEFFFVLSCAFQIWSSQSRKKI